MYSNGDFPTLAPNYRNPNMLPRHLAQGRTDVAWSSAFVLVWDWTWRRYNDLGLAGQHYERARLYLDHLHSFIDPTTHVLPVDWQGGAGLLGDWCAALGVNGTGTGESQFSPRHASGLFNTFFYIRTHEAWLRAHQALGRPGAEAAPYLERLSQARSGFNFVYYQAAEGTYADTAVATNTQACWGPQPPSICYGEEPKQTALALALTLGVARLPHVAASGRVSSALVAEVEAQGRRLTTGLIGTK